jgi:hypothetical protein
MVDKTIMELPDLGSTPADTDYIEIVDVSDTTDDPTGSSKRVSIGDLPIGGASLPADAAGYLENDGAGALSWSTPAGGGMTEIATITDPVSGEFEWTGIPQTYKRLVVKGYIKSASTNAADTVRAWINGLGGVASDYYRSRYLNNNGATVDDATSANDIATVGGSGGINDGSSFSLEIENYTTAGVTKYLSGGSVWAESATHIGKSEYVVRHKTDVAAITELLLKTDGGEDLSGTLTLYGEY